MFVYGKSNGGKEMGRRKLLLKYYGEENGFYDKKCKINASCKMLIIYCDINLFFSILSSFMTNIRIGCLSAYFTNEYFE